MKVVSILPYGGCETMVLSRRRSVHGNSTQLREKFCSTFSPLSRICALRAEVLTFCQNDKESTSVAWARFTLLVQSGPNLSLPKHLLLQYFYTGLEKESAHHFNLTSGGSFAHLTPTDGREVFDKILDRTSFVCVHETPLAEPEVLKEEVPTIESE